MPFEGATRSEWDNWRAILAAEFDDGGHFLRAEWKAHGIRGHGTQGRFILAVLLAFMIGSGKTISQQLREFLMQLGVHGYMPFHRGQPF